MKKLQINSINDTWEYATDNNRFYLQQIYNAEIGLHFESEPTSQDLQQACELLANENLLQLDNIIIKQLDDEIYYINFKN